MVSQPVRNKFGQMLTFDFELKLDYLFEKLNIINHNKKGLGD